MKVGDLYLTKTRIALLRAVAADQVELHIDTGISVRYGGDRMVSRVTAAMRELAAAGLAHTDVPDLGHQTDWVTWQLTTVGRDTLATLDREVLA